MFVWLDFGAKRRQVIIWSKPANRAFLSLVSCTRERPCMHQVRSLLSMRCVLLGYIFEPRPNSHALTTARSVINHKRILALEKNQFVEIEQNWLVQKFGLRRPQRFDAIQAQPPFYYEDEIFSILSTARAWGSVILAGKRDSRRHSTTGFSENIVIVGTGHEM